MKILGIETTCDETGAAIVEGKLNSTSGLKLLSNIVASSADLHKKYGGVVPEVAAREQVKVIVPVVKEALEQAAGFMNRELRIMNKDTIGWARENIDAIAVAHGPGLIGPLLIGVETAKAFAVAWEKPLIAVNHLVGHVYANWLRVDGSRFTEPQFPIVGLIVSGGHTDLVLMKNHGDFQLLGSTLDDAAGEAFDKVAKLLGLGYPGGPEIERAAQQVTIDPSIKLRVNRKQLTYNFPRPLIGSADYNFSFSGLKTAVVTTVNKLSYSSNGSEKFKSVNSSRSARTISDDFKSKIATEFQNAVVDVLVKKTIKAASKFGARSIVVGGGVAANSLLRKEFRVKSLELRIPAYFPSKEVSVDNGAMIAAAAFYNFKKVDPLKLSADPSLHF